MMYYEDKNGLSAVEESEAQAGMGFFPIIPLVLGGIGLVGALLQRKREKQQAKEAAKAAKRAQLEEEARSKQADKSQLWTYAKWGALGLGGVVVVVLAVKALQKRPD